MQTIDNGGQYVSKFGILWRFLLGGQEIDTPGQWEDLLFNFTRNDITASIVESMSYTLQFYGSGGAILRRQIAGVRTDTKALTLTVQKRDYKRGVWETYYEGVINDSTIADHGDYVEASTMETGVSALLIERADEETTVPLTGKRVEIPRMWPASPIVLLSAYPLDPLPFYLSGPPPAVGYVESDIPIIAEIGYKWGCTIDPSQPKATPRMRLSSSIPQPFVGVSALDESCVIAKSGTYRITNNATITLSVYCDYYDDSAGYHQVPLSYREGVFMGNGVVTTASVPPDMVHLITTSGMYIPSGTTQTVYLEKGETLRVCARTAGGGNLVVGGIQNPDKLYFTSGGKGYLYQFMGGSVTIEPIQDPSVNPSISAPAVRDTAVFAELCRRVTKREDLTFDFSHYTAVGGNAYLLDCSRLKESTVEEGVSTVQGNAEARFTGLTLRQFYNYFLAQGYKVSAVWETDRNGTPYEVIRVASYCATGVESFYFPPFNAREPSYIADLGSGITDLKVIEYPNTFHAVTVGRDPEDYGNYKTEDGYQDPTNRKITYGIGVEDKREPYEIAPPWPVSTIGLEEELLTFEGESEQSRADRWTNGGKTWLVTATAAPDGEIEAIIQYAPVEGQFYRPINLGWRPESLVRRNLPLLAMSLSPFAGPLKVYQVQDTEGDTVNVQGTGTAATGDEGLPAFATDSPIDLQGVAGIFQAQVIEFRSATRENVFARIRSSETRYGFIRFVWRGAEVITAMRNIEYNPTRQAVQLWTVYPVWGQSLDFLSR